MKTFLAFCLALGCLMSPLWGADRATDPFGKAPWSDPGFFPIAVWLQSPANAARYKELGVNTYIGLWKGPTEAQLTALKTVGMRVICEQNTVARRHLADPAIIAWMHGDEPDNAQALPGGKGYGPPVLPAKIREDYESLRATDPSRPVLLNLGQGVAWDGWYGRGTRTRHPEDYPDYIQGCDIVSFDIYPAVHDSPEIAGNLWYVARGVERLVGWSQGRKRVWNCLECTRISNVQRKPTPREVRCEAWMSLIHGSQGLIYFVHQFQPEFREAALLDDAEMSAAVRTLNREITQLAHAINGAKLPALSVVSHDTAVPVAATGRRSGKELFVFAVAMRNGSGSATFKLGESLDGSVEVIGEDRSLPVQNGSFTDSFADWAVHLYRVKSQ